MTTGVLGLFALYSPAEQTTKHKPLTSNNRQARDFDNNGILDKTVSIKGRERILFGVMENGRVIYHPADEMEQLFPGTGYSNLEYAALASDLVVLE